MKYTVIAVYREPVQLYAECVEAENPDAAIDAAWLACGEANLWPEDDERKIREEWVDVMVVEGYVNQVPHDIPLESR
jgi:hypothetical protein